MSIPLFLVILLPISVTSNHFSPTSHLSLNHTQCSAFLQLPYTCERERYYIRYVLCSINFSSFDRNPSRLTMSYVGIKIPYNHVGLLEISKQIWLVLKSKWTYSAVTVPSWNFHHLPSGSTNYSLVLFKMSMWLLSQC